MHLVNGSLSSTYPGHGWPFQWGISPITGRPCYEGTDLRGGSDRCVFDELIELTEMPIRLTFDFLTRMQFWPTIFPKVLSRHREYAPSHFQNQMSPDVIIFANGPWEFYSYDGLLVQPPAYFSEHGGYAAALEVFLQELHREIIGNPLILWQGELANLESGRKNLGMTNALQQSALRFVIPFMNRSRMLVPKAPPGYLGDFTATEGGVHATGPVSDATVNMWLNLMRMSTTISTTSGSPDYRTMAPPDHGIRC